MPLSIAISKGCALLGLTVLVLIVACASFSDDPGSLSPDQSTDTGSSTGNDNAAIIADLENRVNAIYNAEWVDWTSANAAVHMYSRWPGIDGLVDLYLATGNSTHIDRAVEMALHYVDLGRDVDGDGYHDWFSGFIDDYNHGHVEFRGAAGVARITEILYSDNSLTEAYETEARLLLDYLEKQVWEKSEAGAFGSRDILNSDVTHFIGRSGLIAVSLYKITADAKYLNWIQTRGAELKNALVLGENGAYTFNCHLDGRSCQDGQIIDTSHAGDTVNFIVEAHRAGLVFDTTDIERLVLTVKEMLWNGSLSSPKFNDLVDGSGRFGNLGRNLGGWVKLADYDDELRDLYLAWVRSDDLVPLSPGFSVTGGTRVHMLGSLAKAYVE